MSLCEAIVAFPLLKSFALHWYSTLYLLMCEVLSAVVWDTLSTVSIFFITLLGLPFREE